MLAEARDKHLERMRLAHAIMLVKAYPSILPEIPSMVRALEIILPWLHEYRKLAKKYGWSDLKD
jgi:hypothetical protein